jgi:beta-lactamase class A
MPFTLKRRSLILGAGLLLPSLGFRAGPAFSAERNIDERLAALEKRTGGRLGVSVLDKRTNISFGCRMDERFAMCSTFKMLAGAFALARVDKGEEDLDRRITYRKADLSPYSPVTEKHTGKKGMTVAELCEAAITLSDNTAANLLLDSFGGPAGLTAWLRSIGDPVTRLDRNEPEMNRVKNGDPRDTTTPQAMLETLDRLVLGDVLKPASREQLIAWLVANKTGDERLRAGLPSGWTVGDKTGTSGKGELGDVAIIWPSKERPILVSVYIADGVGKTKTLNPVFAEIGRMVAEMA